MTLRVLRWNVFACLLVFLSASCPFSAFAESGEHWAFVGFTKYRDALFIDQNRLTGEADQRRQVWSRITPAERSAYFRQIRRNLKKDKKNPNEFRYIEVLNEVDCQSRQIRYLGVAYFRRDGHVISAVRDERPAWQAVHAGSLWDNLLTMVCR